MNRSKILTCAVFVLTLGAPIVTAARADDAMAPKNGMMKKDEMKKDGMMKKDETKTDGMMKKDEMEKGGMMKKEGETQ